MADQRVEMIPISKIKLGRRLRRDLGDIHELSESMAKHGLLNPITLAGDFRLIAGQRRLQAAKLLGWTSITARIIDTESPVELAEIELEENTMRKPFTEDELGDGLLRLDKLRKRGILRRIWAWLKKVFSVFRIRKKK